MVCLLHAGGWKSLSDAVSGLSCMQPCLLLCVCMCMHIFVCQVQSSTHTHAHTHTHTHTHTHAHTHTRTHTHTQHLLSLQQVERFSADDKLHLSAMVPTLRGVHPDDAFSAIPYEKGSSFLFSLESLLGGTGRQSLDCC